MTLQASSTWWTGWICRTVPCEKKPIKVELIKRLIFKCREKHDSGTCFFKAIANFRLQSVWRTSGISLEIWSNIELSQKLSSESFYKKYCDAGNSKCVWKFIFADIYFIIDIIYNNFKRQTFNNWSRKTHQILFQTHHGIKNKVKTRTEMHLVILSISNLASPKEAKSLKILMHTLFKKSQLKSCQFSVN